MISICARRSPTTIRVREAHVERLNKSTEMEYEILNVLEFNRFVLLSAVYLVIFFSNFLIMGRTQDHFTLILSCFIVFHRRACTFELDIPYRLSLICGFR